MRKKVGNGFAADGERIVCDLGIEIVDHFSIWGYHIFIWVYIGDLSDLIEQCSADVCKSFLVQIFTAIFPLLKFLSILLR